MNGTKLILGISGATVGLLLSGCGGITEAVDEAVDVAAGGSAGYGCDELADEAVRISEEEDGFFTLLKVREPRIVKDNRETYTLPTGDAEAVILVCDGTGVWNDGDKTGVRLKWTVDADGDEWVFYEPQAN
jgi:hypothetical protein